MTLYLALPQAIPSVSGPSVGIAAVIPTFNRSRLIGRAIESVLAQNRQPDQVIVVDDGSRPTTRRSGQSRGIAQV